jgi:hypothetical protein
VHASQIFLWRDAQLHRRAEPRADGRDLLDHQRVDVRQLLENASLFDCFPLCLTRACLGKMIIFSIKWRQKDAFSHLRVGSNVAVGALGQRG